MLKERPQPQSTLEFASIGEPVPSDHLLHKIDHTIDFTYLHDLMKDLYCTDNGCPAIGGYLVSAG